MSVLMDWLKKAPTAITITVLVLCGVLALGVLGAYVALSWHGDQNALSDFRQWVQTIGITLVLPLLGINTVASVVGAKSSSNAEDNTNGRLTALQQENADLRQQLTDREAV
jgi:hypothetical protein